jgi:hypothetical protein
LVSPATVSGDAAPVAASAPGLHVAVYEVTAAPPSLDGGVNAMVAAPLPGVAVPMTGAPGTVAGVTLLEAADAAPVPRALVAVTLNVYAVPFVRPLTTIDAQGATHVPVAPQGAEVAVNVVMAEPPSLAGAVNATVACALPRVAAPITGAPGTVDGVTLFEGADAGPVPAELVAATVNVYAVPLVSPVTVMDMQGALHVAVAPPGEEVAMYDTIAEPPLLAGAVNATVACELPAVAVPIVGAPGTAEGVTLFDAADGAPVPTALMAATVNV